MAHHVTRRMPDIIVSEVGPRDGLQSTHRIMQTKDKIAWVRALAASGLTEIEVGSFVSPSLLPQMADTAEVVAEVRAIDNLCVLALVPNGKGAQRAFAAGVDRVTMPVSASAAHSLANINRTPAEAVAEVARVCAMRDQFASAGGERPISIEVGISTAFGCSIEGTVAEDEVIKLAIALAKAGADSIGLSDTTGMGNPAQVRRLFKRLFAELGDKAGGAHFHNTRGQGLANVVAALETGVTIFDASLGGLGGCPYAPGASGNIVTEDLVFLLEAMGLHTGIDMAALLHARQILAAAMPGESLYGHLGDAGLPKGFHYANAGARS